MTGQDPTPVVEIDTSKPHPARMYDWYLGGKDNYPVDEALGRQMLALDPRVPVMARVNRASCTGRRAGWPATASASSWTSVPASRPSPICTRSPRRSRRTPGSSTATTTRSCWPTRPPAAQHARRCHGVPPGGRPRPGHHRRGGQEDPGLRPAGGPVADRAAALLSDEDGAHELVSRLLAELPRAAT